MLTGDITFLILKGPGNIHETSTVTRQYMRDASLYYFLCLIVDNGFGNFRILQRKGSPESATFFFMLYFNQLYII